MSGPGATVFLGPFSREYVFAHIRKQKSRNDNNNESIGFVVKEYEPRTM